MLASRPCLPQESCIASFQYLLVRRPVFQRTARKTADLPSQIRVREYRGVEVRAVGAACPGAETGVRVQALRAAEDVAELRVDIRAAFRCTGLGAGLDRVPTPLFCRDEDGMVCRCR